VNGRKGLSGRDDAFFILVQYYSSITCGHFGLDAGGAHYLVQARDDEGNEGQGRSANRDGRLQGNSPCG
jgi:hypothetical protein